MIKRAMLLLGALLCLSSIVMAQISDTTRLEGRYEIGKITVRGAQEADPGAIIAFSGLRVGQVIDFPGQQINQAIKAIWAQRLFADIEIQQQKVIGDIIFLEIIVKELAQLHRYQLNGVKSSERKNLEELLNTILIQGTILTEHDRQRAKAVIKTYFEEKGYPNAVVRTRLKPVANQDRIELVLEVDKRDRVKIQKISFSGNTQISTRKLRKLMSNSQEKKRWFKKSLLTSEGFKEDKARILARYQELGYRDARISKEKIRISPQGDWNIQLTIDEGAPYTFGKITWRDYGIYPVEVLNEVLGIQTGDPYHPQLLEERLYFSQNGRDISSLYMDQGYLFFQVEAVETGINDHAIDLEIRLQEGPQAVIGKVKISGNATTSEEVIRREIRTQPGDLFSRAALIRSQREIINLGYFNPEKVDIRTDVHPENGTVDIEYIVEEKSNDQLELALGWDPASNQLQGTIGVALNNFSTARIFDKDVWQPFPRGDGQQLSLRFQSTGRNYQSYNLSFTEPWLGGKKPTNLTVSGFYTNRFFEGTEGTNERFNILGGVVQLSTRLRFPDDHFIYSAGLNVQRIQLENWQVDGFVLEDGSYLSDGNFYNIYLKQTLARNSLNHPIFPTGGSLFSLSAQTTLPYSWLGLSNDSDDPAEQFKWLEYYKIRFESTVYKSLGRKLVLKGSAKLGLLGSYQSSATLSPFERFWFGGDGLSGQQGFGGVDLISMRGYDDQRDFDANLNGGATVFSKYTLELRYPLLQSPAANMQALIFAEAGNAWGQLDQVRPFDLQRSVGAGIRIHLPMFGMLGFDYGLGFDKDPISGQSIWSKYGSINLILGFEPD